MCKYCDEKRKYIEDYINENSQHIRIYIENKELYFETYCFIEKIKINYCPMCGRLVNKKVLEDIKKSIGDPKHGGTVGVNVAMPVFNEIGIDIQGEINKIIEKSMFDRRKFYARRYVVNGRARLY